MDLWPCLYLYIQHYNTFCTYENNEVIGTEVNADIDEFEVEESDYDEFEKQ